MVISGKTRIIGIFGNPIEHSFSPRMHNKAFEFMGLDYCYVPFLVAEKDLAMAVESIRALNMVGVNVTIPHKSKVMEFLDEVTAEAQAMGAVNVITNDQGKLTGHNTDGAGFYRSLEELTGTGVTRQKIVLLGAGGAARGVAIYLALKGAAQITIVNRSLQRGAELVSSIQKLNSGCDARFLDFTGENLAAILPDADVLINTTSMGMYPNHNQPSPVQGQLIGANLVVCDLVYNPQETNLLKEAKGRGARVLSGLGMLLYQGVIAFELWTGQPAPVEVMSQGLLEIINNQIM